MIPLAEYVSRYALAADLTRGSIDQLRYTVVCIDRWKGSPVLLSELSDDLANRWLSWLLESGLSRTTVRHRRGNLITLWRAAAESGLVESWPKRVKKIKVPNSLPEAWSRSQVDTLLRASADLRGEFPGGIDRAKLVRALILTDWATGLRPCDLLALRRRDVAPDGSIAIVQQKTGWPILCRLTPEAMAAVEATFPPKRALLFPIERRLAHFWIRRLCQAVQLPGSTKWIRRSGATAVEDEQPGSAQHYLGHRTPGLAWKCYIDPRHLTKRQHRPPPPLTG